MKMTLRYQGIAVGTIHNAFCNDGVWFGTFHPAIAHDHLSLRQRVSQFIEFCEQWNERARGSEADVADFSTFEDVVANGSWLAECQEGKQHLIVEDAPDFFVGGEVSFRERGR